MGPRTPPISFIERKSPIQDRSKVTYESILQGAIQLLNSGRKAFTTIQIAKVAGVSVGSLYQYFPNKQAITAKLIEYHVQVTLTEIQKIIDSIHSPHVEDYIEPIVGFMVNLYYDRRYVFYFMTKNIEDVHRMDAFLYVKGESARIMAKAYKERQLHPARPDVDAAMQLMVQSVIGVLEQIVLYELETFDKEAVKKQLCGLVRSYLIPH